MKLTPNQEQRLADIRYARRFGLSTFNSHDLPDILLDIIDTLIATDALPKTYAASDSSHDGYEWREHPMEPSGKHGDWYKKGAGG